MLAAGNAQRATCNGQRATPRGKQANWQLVTCNAQRATGTKLTVGGGGAICCCCFFFERLADRWCLGVDGAGSLLPLDARRCRSPGVRCSIWATIEAFNRASLNTPWNVDLLLAMQPVEAASYPLAPLQQLPLSCTRTRFLPLSLSVCGPLVRLWNVPKPHRGCLCVCYDCVGVRSL